VQIDGRSERSKNLIIASVRVKSRVPNRLGYTGCGNVEANLLIAKRLNLCWQENMVLMVVRVLLGPIVTAANMSRHAVQGSRDSNEGPQVNQY
jgi:hypothetical protein